MTIKTAFVLLAAVAAAATTGCGSSSSNEPIGETRASLHRAKNCDDLLTDLKADASFKLNRGIDRQIESIRQCMSRYGDAQCASFGGYYGGGGARGTALDDAAAAPESAANGGSATPPNDRASSYSETNVQVQGVDEADIVKTDGKHLFLLHGRAFKVLNAWPANALAELGSIDVEGNPSEMFVHEGKVVVYSQVNGAKIFEAAGVTPKEQYQDYVYYGPGGGIAVDASVRAPGLPYPGSGEQYAPLTKITVLALDGATPRVTREVYFEGGYLDSRRVGPHVRTVLQGFAHGPKLKYGVHELYAQPTTTYDPATGVYTEHKPYPQTGTAMIAALEDLRRDNLQVIAASQLGDWLPYSFVKDGDKVTATTVQCNDFYVPSAGSTESGITEVASIDLDDPAAPPKETAILGRADTVYGSADTLYLAAHAWVEPPVVWADDTAVSSGGGTPGSVGSTEPALPPSPAAEEPTPGPTPQARSLRPASTPALTEGAVNVYATNKTHLHKFEFTTDAKFPNYVASGTVVGSVKNQFSLDDREGFLRIATTESRMYVDTAGRYVSPTWTDPSVPNQPPPERPSTVNHVFALAQHGQWLDPVGDVGDLAPNEQIFSVRFVGRRGYVVTFRQVDPLFVVDLADPAQPKLLAALKIPGFSEYMHPIDENHLLTIGRDATDTGRAQGLQLQIFDVTDGANPILRHKHTYSSQEHGSSEAEYDHKAFTFFADRNLLAFPYLANNLVSGDYTMRSSLELFRVDLAAGFKKVGSIDHSALVGRNPSGYCGGWYSPSVRRGVFLENFVYSVSYGGVVVKDSNDLGAAGTSLPLAAPQTNEGYGPACF